MKIDSNPASKVNPAVKDDRTLRENLADSLVITELVMELEDRFDVEIPRNWLEKDTVGELKRKIGQMSES